jgi:hypothetical protein
MKCKTAAFMILLIFSASAFAITSTLSVISDSIPDTETYTFDFGLDPIRPCDPVPGGGPGGDN